MDVEQLKRRAAALVREASQIDVDGLVSGQQLRLALHQLATSLADCARELEERGISE